MKRSSVMLTLIRCGQTQWEQEGRLHGRTDLPLSDAGRASVAADAERLAHAPSVILHPSDEAATETARIVAATATSGKAKTRAVDELAEPDLGLLEGLLERQFIERYGKRRKQWQDEPLSMVPPEGEPFADARARLFTALAKSLKRTRAGEVAVVLHPIALGLLRCWLADRPPAEMWNLLATRDRVERYVLPLAMVDALRDAGRMEAVES